MTFTRAVLKILTCECGYRYHVPPPTSVYTMCVCIWYEYNVYAKGCMYNYVHTVLPNKQPASGCLQPLLVYEL